MTAPAPQVQYAGVGVVGADQYNTYIQVLQSIAQLRNFTGLNNMVVWCMGTSTPVDGGQRMYYFNATSTAADNGTTVIVPSGATVGAWLAFTGTNNI